MGYADPGWLHCPEYSNYLCQADDDPGTGSATSRHPARAPNARPAQRRLARPARAVLSRGDSNLLNWLHDGHTLRCVDFEFSGRSDIAFDAADQIEHISSRAIPDHAWHQLEANLGVDHHNRPRFEAAQRTCALCWLAVLWKQRHRRTEEFTTQLNRVRQLQRSAEGLLGSGQRLIPPPQFAR
ncbi:MAG: phosphotransferase family protein [Pseudonocardiaceae bacterium]